jgi:hypothetical protein
MRVGYSTITGNTNSIAPIGNGATLTSYGNNQIDGNSSSPVIPTSPLN